MLGEEDDLAGVARQLRGEVGGELGLGRADAPHHGEDVLAGALLRGLAQLAGRDPTDQLVVDAVDCVARLAPRTASALS